MNKTIENKWVQLSLYIIITIIMSLIIFPLLDWIYSLISNNTFVYSVHEHIQRPAEVGFLLGLVSWVVQNGLKKREQR